VCGAQHIEEMAYLLRISRDASLSASAGQGILPSDTKAQDTAHAG
jgi:hypothetical protein